MHCAASVPLERAAPGRSTIYAAEGSVAHLIASNLLLDPDYFVPVGQTIIYEGHSILVTRDMQEYVADYVKLVQGYARDGTLLVDQKVDFSRYVGKPGQKGTADAIIVKHRTLIMIDLKYGIGVPVFASNAFHEDGTIEMVEPYLLVNEQLGLYGLGSYDIASLIDEIDEIVLVIHQPRLNSVSEFVIETEQLLKFGERANAAARRVEEALALQEQGALQADSPYFVPGEKQCRFCDAKTTCPALREEVMLYSSGYTVMSPTSVEEFAQFVPVTPDADSLNSYLSIAMKKVGLVEDWCKAIRAEIERRLLLGQPVEDWKLVEGKMGNRSWIDAKEAEAFMRADLLLADDLVYDKSVVSPTTAEKHLKKKHPDDWAALQALITRRPGKPSVAPATDPRPALTLSAETAASLREAALEDGE
jgi:hypothetical protein